MAVDSYEHQCVSIRQRHEIDRVQGSSLISSSLPAIDGIDLRISVDVFQA